MKVDIDGRELDVLKGATETLKDTVCIVLEATLAKLAQSATFLEAHGFFLWDLVDPMYADNVLWQVDLVFLSCRLDANRFIRIPQGTGSKNSVPLDNLCE